MSYLENAQRLCQMIGQGDLMGAVDTFYHDDVTIIEANGDTFNGKETQKQRIAEWSAGVVEMHGGGIHAVTANEDEGITMIESWTDATFKQGRTTFEEVAVQHWKDGKIVRERFYYNMHSM